jgi:transcriptional regulator with XRE-family HTH domain
MKIVPHVLKELRKQSGLTQDELGAMAGIQKSGIAKYENGRIGSAPDDTIEAFAAALNTTVDYLSGKLEADLYALDIEVVRTGVEVQVEDLTSHKRLTFSAEEWRALAENAAAGFRTLWEVLTETEQPTPGDESGLTPAQLTAWELVCRMDDAALDRFIAAARAFIG